MITISEDVALELLEKRLKEALDAWGNVDDMDLFMDMYEYLIESGADFIDFDPMVIVDNDVVNYCVVLRREDNADDFDKVLSIWMNDEREVLNGTLEYYNGYYIIEACDQQHEKFLLRYC